MVLLNHKIQSIASGNIRVGASDNSEEGWVPFEAIAAISGVFHTLRPLPTNRTNLFLQADLVPKPNLGFGVGSISQPRYLSHIVGRDLFCETIVGIDTLGEITGAQIEVSGQLLPWKDPFLDPSEPSPYALGSPNIQWTHLYANSGVFSDTLAAPTATIAGLSVTSDATFDTATFVINTDPAIDESRPVINGSGVATINDIMAWEHGYVLDAATGLTNKNLVRGVRHQTNGNFWFVRNEPLIVL
jgi:hypothetical protein